MTACPRPRFARREPAGREPARGAPAPNAAAPDPLAEAARGQFRVKWVHYRGAGKAKVVPGESAVLAADGRPTLTEGKSTANVTFDWPGAYTLRAYVMDGDAFFVTHDVDVTVTNK